MEDRTRAILEGRLELALKGLQDPPTNDPDAFDAISLARHTRAVTRQHPTPPKWMPSVSLESKLLAVAGVLPLAAQHSPANVRALAEGTFHLIKSDFTLVEAERVDQEFRARLRAGGSEFFPSEPLLDRLFATMRLTDDQFPHGLLPPEPAWPEPVLAFDPTGHRASTAFSDLHLKGWDVAVEHLTFRDNFSRIKAKAAYDAQRAFAKVAAGRNAVESVNWHWKHLVLRTQGAAEALLLARPITEWARHSWSGYSDFGFVEAIATQFIKDGDWDAAEGVATMMAEYEDATEDEVRKLVSIQRRVSRHLNSAPQAKRTTRGSDSRPSRLMTPPAAPRPPSAQAIVDSAESGDVQAQRFLEDLKSAHSAEERARNRELTAGHLWLLHELDSTWINGQVLKHAEADRQLRISILSQGRHGQSRRPALSGYAYLLVPQRIELAEDALEHAIDEGLISDALKAHSEDLDPTYIATLALRTLDWPAERAAAVLKEITVQVGHRLSTDLAGTLELARREVSGEPIDRMKLREDLAKLARAPRKPRSAESQTPETLVSAIEAAINVSGIEIAIHSWREGLPWTDLIEAVDGRRLSTVAVIRLARRPDAPGALVRRAVKMDGFSLVMGGDIIEPWRLMNALLEAPIDTDPILSKTRFWLAIDLLYRDPRDLEVRLPHAELTKAATATAVKHLSVLRGKGGPLVWQLWEAAVRWCVTDVVNLSLLSVTLPMRRGAALMAAVTSEGEGPHPLMLPGGEVPTEMTDWLRIQLGSTERYVDDDIIERVLDMVPAWEGSLTQLVGVAEELQEKRDEN